MAGEVTMRINLLPWRSMRRNQIRRKRWLQGGAGLIVFSLLVLFVRCHAEQQKPDSTLIKTSNTPRVPLKKQKPLKHRQDKTTKAIHVSLDTLHYVGLIADTTKTWALIIQPDGQVLTVMTGEYLGKECGKIMQITPDTLELQQVVRTNHGVSHKRIMMQPRQV
jgi:Tfp pilus assembly protein PilP